MKSEFFTEHKRDIILTGIGIIAVVILFYTREFSRDCYIKDENGEIKAVVRSDGNEDIPVTVEVTCDGNRKKKEVILRFRDGKVQAVEETEDNSDQVLESQIRKAVGKVEEDDNKEIALPKKGEDGAVFSWTKRKNLKPLLLPAFFPVILYGFYVSDRGKIKKKRKKYVQDVKREIPEFSNQLLLLLNSGLVFSDAYEKIAQGYKSCNQENSSFKQIITKVYDESRTDDRSLATVFDYHCRKSGIRELTRISAIILNHQYMGSNLTEKLQAESEILWMDRKKDAEVQGKLGETKLSFPLAILLVVLIMVTTAPAVIEM